MDSILQSLRGAAEWVFFSSCQASVVIGLVFLAQWSLQKWLPPRWRYRLWLLVLIRLILPVTPESPFSIFNYTDDASAILARNANSSLPRAERRPAGGTGASRQASSELDGPSTGGSASLQGASGGSVATAVDLGKSGTAGPDRAAKLATTGGYTEQSACALWLAGAWLLGALFLAVRVLWFPWRLNVKLARHETPAGADLFKILEESKRLIRVNRVLPIVQSRAVSGPALLGFVRPWLLLPDGMVEKLSAQELRFVFLHELAHLKRHDIAVNWLMTLVQIVHWFNPFVWLAFNRMRADRELACDELALMHSPDSERAPYGQTIIRLLEDFTRPARIAGLAGILEDKQQMKRRIKMIAQFKKTSAFSPLAPVLVFALGIAGLTGGQTGALDPSLAGGGPPVASGLTMRRIPDLPEDYWLAHDVSPDGRYVLGITHKRDYAIFDLATGSKRMLRTELDGSRFFASKFMPDGKKIIGILREQNQWKGLAFLDLDSQELVQIYQGTNMLDLVIRDVSPDGQNLLARLSRNDKEELVLFSIAEGSIGTLKTFSADNYLGGTACFSADGSWIAYEHSIYTPGESGVSDVQWGISLLASDGSADRPILRHASRNELFGWSPHGNQILFASDRRGTWDAFTIQVENGKPIGNPVLLKEAISKRPLFGGLAQGVGFTTKGSFYYMAETDAWDVYSVNLDPVTGKVHGEPAKVAAVEESNQFPAWSPDSRYLAYISRRGAATPGGTPDGLICIRDFTGGVVRELPTDAGTVSYPRWGPEGDSLFAVSWADGKRLAYRIDVQSGKSEVVAKGLRIGYGVWPLWSWEANGKAFYEFQQRTALMRHDIETGDTTEISIPLNGYNAILSPDGNYFAYSYTSGTSNSTKRTVSVVSFGGGEDGRALVRLSGSEAVEEFQPAGDRGLGWSPDSRFVLFIKGAADKYRVRSLWKVPIEGGEPEPLGVEMYEFREPIISPDGRRLAFTGGGIMSELWVMENFLPKDDVAVK